MTFFQRRNKNGKQVHEKVFNITNHQGNANENYYEISPLIGMKINTNIVENSIDILQKIKHRNIKYSSNPISGYTGWDKSKFTVVCIENISIVNR